MFLGASYFRALGAGQRYGLSARGLAIDTVGGQGEEFPRFTEFWFVKPAADAKTLTVYALLDSPRATGAYQFDIHPGAETVMDVRARIFLRASVATLGIAPLTSMFFFGENQPHRTDFRPEVHDSDGLMVATGDGEWLWRPLLNPRQTLTTSFSMRNAARLRPDAARPRVPQLRGRRSALRAAAERMGRADRHLGAGPRRAHAAAHSRRDQRQHRRVLGAARCARTGPAARLHVSIALAGNAAGTAPAGCVGLADACRPRLRRARRRRATICRRLQRSIARSAAGRCRR